MLANGSATQFYITEHFSKSCITPSDSLQGIESVNEALSSVGLNGRVLPLVDSALPGNMILAFMAIYCETLLCFWNVADNNLSPGERNE